MVMREALRDRDGVWFGWSGNIVDADTGAARTMTSGATTYATVDLTRAEYERYYLGFANATLWPILHYRLGLVDYDRDDYEGYLQVNARFARALQPLLRPDDFVWVHDYHLIPFAAALRRLGVGNPIGFFLHTPFPSADVLSALPRHEELLAALVAYDLVGFQTDDLLQAFLGCLTRLVAGSSPGCSRFLAGRSYRTGVFPVGIDADALAGAADQAAHSTELRRLESSLQGRGLVIGVDRLDYSKGIAQRFKAIEKLLNEWPEHRRNVDYLQVTPHSRDELPHYRALRRELEASAGRINGKYAECDWSPIHYVNKSFSRQTLAAFYRLAHVGLVTPLRDGMNLVAKEFVAAQSAADPGVLVLSRFAGAARELGGALLVNPIDTSEIAGALHRALAMPLQERQERWRAMIAILRDNTIETWRASFLAALADAGTRTVQRLARGAAT